MIATRFTVRLLGLISVTVLARLLTPADFGLFGSAALALSFFILLKEIGFGEVLIKQKTLEKADIDTIWTIRFILSLLIAALVTITAPFVAEFLKDPRIEDVLYFMALVPVIDSFSSPASPFLLREFKYGSDFLLKSSIKVVRVAVVIGVAIALRSYWALVVGALLSSVFSVIVTHMVRPYRPKLTLSKLKHHRNFAAWSYMRSMSDYLSRTSDEFVIRATQNTAFFGIYHVARDLSRILISELVSPIGEAMLPALSRLQGTQKRFSKAVTNIVGASFIVAVAVATGVIVTAHELVLVILGPQWVPTSKYLVWLAAGTACNSVGYINRSSFIAADRIKISANFWIARAVIYSAGCLVAALYAEPVTVAMTFTFLSAGFLVTETHTLLKTVNSADNLLQLTYRPLLSGFLMALAVANMPVADTWPTVVILLLKVFTGVFVYGASMLVFWKLANSSDGPEDALLQYLPGRLNKLVTRVVK